MLVGPNVDHDTLSIFPELGGLALGKLHSVLDFAGPGLVCARGARGARGARPASPEVVSGEDVAPDS